MIPAPKALEQYQVSFQFQLLDLAALNDEEIQGEPILRSTLRLLKYSRSVELRNKLRKILEILSLAVLSKSIGEEQLAEWLAAIGSYLMAVNKNMDSQQYKQTLASVFPTQFEPGSLADRLLEQGREEGLEKGREEGLEKGREEARSVLISTVQMLQELLQEAPTQLTELQSLSMNALKDRVDQLQQRLRHRQG